MPDAVPKDVEVPPPGPAADQAGESEPKPRRRGIDARTLDGGADRDGTEVGGLQRTQPAEEPTDRGASRAHDDGGTLTGHQRITGWGE